MIWNWQKLVHCTLAATALVTGGWTQNQQVQVQFRIKDTQFNSELGVNGTKEAERLYLPLVIGELQRSIAFVNFTSSDQPYVLLIELGQKSSGSRAVQFQASLSNSGVVKANTKWTFRSWDRSLEPFSEKESIPDKIHDPNMMGGPRSSPGELQRQLNQGINKLLSDVFSVLPLSAKASLREGPPNPRWELDMKRSDNCLDLNSRFHIEHTLSFDDQHEESLPLDVEVRGPIDANSIPITARLPDAPDQTRSLSLLADPHLKQTTVAKVFLIKYFHSYSCPPIVPPLNSGLAGSGQ